jgi:carbonic anhydrase
MPSLPTFPCGCPHPGRRGLLGLGLACLAAGAARAATGPTTSLTPDQALAKLLEGNAGFVQGRVDTEAADPRHRMALARGQAPFAAVLGCADSRTPPELLFQAGLGEIFAVRNAGNVAETSAIGSLEYAVAVLRVPLVMVLGHEGCGAVAGALGVAETDVVLPGRISEIVQPILPAAMVALRGAGGDRLDVAVSEHARRMALRLTTASPVLGAAVASGRLRVVAARYDLDEGRVQLLG